MQVFFSDIFPDEQTILLSAEESKHCIKVLRHKIGDVIHVIDGKGNSYKAEITDSNPQKCVLTILEKTKIASQKKYRLHIAISPTKNPDRIEWLIEKCTEFGVDEFSFIICKRTEKPSVKMERLKKITESAVKQSIQAIIPIMNEATSFKEFVISHKAISQKYIAHCLEKEKNELKDILTKTNDALILIGPEGDFTEDEIQLALENNFVPLSLGSTRLRTETAGLFAAAAFKARYDI